MSTSDQPESGSLTRKQLREVRLTGSTPVVTPEAAEAAKAVSRVAVDVETAPTATPVVPAAPLPRAAEPVVIPPVATVESVAATDAPMTRRRARIEERMRTGSIATTTGEEHAAVPPVPDAAAAAETPAVVTPAVTPATPAPSVEQEEPALESAPAPMQDAPVAPISSVPVIPAAAPGDAPDAVPGFDVPDVEPVESISWDSPVSKESVSTLFGRPAEEPAPSFGAPSFGDLPFDRQTGEVEVAPAVTQPTLQPPTSRPTVNPGFGESLLAEERASSRVSSSFNELLATSGDTAGSSRVAPSALIYSQAPGAGSLSGPVPATGEILITGTMSLPDGIGSQGHAIGAADGKEVDAVLLDGEIPAASSPVPIAASSAISTIKPAGEVIRPPEPDKGNKLMLALTITAGALALALVGALVVAFTTGVFS